MSIEYFSCTDRKIKSKRPEPTDQSVRSTFEARRNKAGYTATPVACGWAGAVLEKVIGAFWQEQ